MGRGREATAGYLNWLSVPESPRRCYLRAGAGAKGTSRPRPGRLPLGLSPVPLLAIVPRAMARDSARVICLDS